MMLGGPSPSKLSARLIAVAHHFISDSPAERLDRAQRRLLNAIKAHEPATLGEVATVVGRGAPSVSRSVDSLVRAGLIDRVQDPDNRRRLALTLTEVGRSQLADAPPGSALTGRLERLAQSELRAIERAIEILERH